MRFRELIRSKATLPALVIAIVGVGFVLYAWQLPPFTSTVQNTNNAYVKGRVTLIAPQLAGYVAEVPVTDYKEVKKGDLLVRLDDRIYQQQLNQAEATLAQQQTTLATFDQNRMSKEASVQQAKAQLAGAEAALANAQRSAERSNSLTQSGISAQAAGDQARLAVAQAQASVDQATAALSIANENLALVDAGKPGLEAAVKGAQASVDLAKINLSNTRITAPVDGRLGEVTARVGQYLSAGSQVTSVTPVQTWIVANFKETQLTGVKIGQPATFTVDALDGARFDGWLSEISPATGSEFSVLKPDNATGNFTKIAQRIPIRIEITPGQPQLDQLRPGMSVEVNVDTATSPLSTGDRKSIALASQ